MSNSPQKQQVVGIPDKEILHKFLVEAEPLLAEEKQNESTLCDIYRRAAKELEKYYDDQSMISQRLCRVFPSKQSRLIRYSLDKKYKRDYNPLDDDNNDLIPTTDIEELFEVIQDALDGLSRVNNRIRQKISHSPQLQKKILSGKELTDDEKEKYTLTLEYRKTILNAFGNVSELKKYIETVKDMAVDVEIVQDELDNRLKLDEYTRVIIKLYDLVYRYRKIGKIWHKSAKWIKQIVEDPELEKIIEQAENCPECGFEWSGMFKKQAKRMNKGLTPTLPAGFVIDWKGVV